MAQGVGSANAVANGQDVFGGHLWGEVDYNGPASYVQGGDAVDPAIFGFPNTITHLFGSVDQSGVYVVEGRPINASTTVWQLVWTSVAGNGEVAGATNLSTKTVRLSAIGY